MRRYKGINQKNTGTYDVLFVIDYHASGLTRTAPAGLSIADTHVSSSLLQHGVVTSSQLSSRTAPLTRGMFILIKSSCWWTINI